MRKISVKNRNILRLLINVSVSCIFLHYCIKEGNNINVQFYNEMHHLWSPGEVWKVLVSHSWPGLARREADIEDHRGVAGDVVDIAGGGVDEEDLSVRSNSVTWNRSSSSLSGWSPHNSLPSCMCPYTWYLGFILFWTEWRSSTQPALTPVQVRSPKPRGGPWVMRTSTSSGMRFHLLRHGWPRTRLKAQPPYSGWWGVPATTQLWSDEQTIRCQVSQCLSDRATLYFLRAWS